MQLRIAPPVLKSRFYKLPEMLFIAGLQLNPSTLQDAALCIQEKINPICIVLELQSFVEHQNNVKSPIFILQPQNVRYEIHKAAMHMKLNKVSEDEVGWGCLRLTLPTCALHASSPLIFSGPLLHLCMLQWIRESADLVRLASLICDERGRVGPHGAATEPCGQVELLLHLPSQL